MAPSIYRQFRLTLNSLGWFNLISDCLAFSQIATVIGLVTQRTLCPTKGEESALRDETKQRLGRRLLRARFHFIEESCPI